MNMRFSLPSSTELCASIVFVWCISLFTSLHLYASQSATQPLPLDVFYRDALVENLELSPDGTHLLALKNIGSETVVMVVDLNTGKTFYPVKSDNKEFKFNWVRWANNDRLLMSLRFDSRAYNGVKYMQSRLLAIDAKKPSKMITLGKSNGDEAAYWVSQFQDNVISFLPDDPKHVLISVDREAPLHQTVYKANVYTGRLTRVKKHAPSGALGMPTARAMCRQFCRYIGPDWSA